MNKELLNCAFDQVKDRYVTATATPPKKSGAIVRRVLAAAACIAILLAAVPLSLFLYQQTVTPPAVTDHGTPPREAFDLNGGEIPLTACGTEGRLLPLKSYGSPVVTLTGKPIPPQLQFDADELVVEARAVTLLDDLYLWAGTSTPYYLLKLEILDTVVGEGVPQEIFLCIPQLIRDLSQGDTVRPYSAEHVASLLDYDSLIICMEQEGIEDFPIYNSRTQKIETFDGMFSISTTYPCYGGVIAMKDGSVDGGFWEREGSGYRSLGKTYPGRPEYGKADIKDEIRRQAAELQAKHGYVEAVVWAEDIFTTEEAQRVWQEVQLSETNVFMQECRMDSNGVRMIFSRAINGYASHEKITVRSAWDGTVSVERTGEAYTPEDLAQLPDLAYVMDRLKLSSLAAPHTNMTEDMKLSYCTAEAWYKKADGKVFGVVKIYWEFSSPLHKKKKCCDDAYLLFSSDGSYRRVEYGEFSEIIGENDFYYYPIEYNVWSS